LRRRLPEKRLVVEVKDTQTALRMARAGAEVLQLERMAPPEVAALREALRAAGLAPLLAPAGGVNLGNAVAYAQAGADLLVTSSPYFAPPADVRVCIVAGD
jgi:molybdenum transport protein